LTFKGKLKSLSDESVAMARKVREVAIDQKQKEHWGADGLKMAGIRRQEEEKERMKRMQGSFNLN